MCLKFVLLYYAIKYAQSIFKCGKQECDFLIRKECESIEMDKKVAFYGNNNLFQKVTVLINQFFNF